MKDQRLIDENLILALDELGVTPDTIDGVHLYFNQLLTTQAGDACSRFGIAEHQQHVDYAEWFDCRWGIEFGGVRIERNGKCTGAGVRATKGEVHRQTAEWLNGSVVE